MGATCVKKISVFAASKAAVTSKGQKAVLSSMIKKRPAAAATSTSTNLPSGTSETTTTESDITTPEKKLKLDSSAAATKTNALSSLMGDYSDSSSDSNGND